jgi:hypothetical protein
MSEPAVYCTDKELIARIGVGLNSGARALKAMRKHPLCPPRSIGGKTYWPAFRNFLDLWNHNNLAAPGIPAGQEKSDGETKHHGRPRHRLAAAKERLARDLASTSGSR